MGTEKCQKRVLVVEDNELNRKIAAQVIEDEGILTECAIDGLEAVKKVREAPEQGYMLFLRLRSRSAQCLQICSDRIRYLLLLPGFRLSFS